MCVATRARVDESSGGVGAKRGSLCDLEDKVIANLVEGQKGHETGDPGLQVVVALVEASHKAEGERTTIRVETGSSRSWRESATSFIW